VEVSIGSRSERKCATALLQPFYALEQVANGAGEAVETNDDEYVAGGDLAHQLGQHRPRARGAGAVLLMDQAAADRLEFVDLGVSRLILGRDTGIANKAADRGSCGLSAHLVDFAGDFRAFVHIGNVPENDRLAPGALAIRRNSTSRGLKSTP
jgi:hypothetical protein